MKKNILLVVILSLFVNLCLVNADANAQDKIQCQFDYAVFKGADSKSILEIYYSFYQKSLIYRQNASNGYEAIASLAITIIDANTKEVKFSELYNIPSVVNDTSGNELKKNLVGQINFQLSPGSYDVAISGSDANNPDNKDSVSISIDVRQFDNNPNISDIELSSMIAKSTDTESILYKNTLEVVPNPGVLFGNNLNKLYYYTELYGLKNIGKDNVVFTETISDENNNNVFNRVKKVNTSSDSKVEYGFIALDSLPSASYLLTLSLVDSTKNLSVVKSKKFWVYNSNVVQTSNQGLSDGNFLTSEYASMREELVDKDFELTLYLRNDDIKKGYENAKTVDEKRKFMFEFWKKRDTNPATPQNEFKREYLKRVLEANNLFKEPFKEGWLTDRGRIYIEFGKPDDIERNPYSSDKKSYEIWRYDNLEGGAECVFGEIQSNGSGIFELIHSTIRSELRNDNWQQLLEK